jgi:zinc/manganese transport system permease protein
MNLDALDASILLPAFVAGLLVVSTHVPLGGRVLSRGIIFIDLAVAQVAGLGVILADTLGFEIHGWGAQITAGLAAITAAALLSWMEKRWADVQEALIGVMFVLAATASLLLLAGNPHGGENLRELLVGQILWVTYDQLWPIALLYAGVLASWYGFARHRGQIWFYGLFAVTVTASVQLVGVYLVFASLIIPALATRHNQGLGRLARGYAIGAVGYAAGLVLSSMFDLPSGAVVVWTLAATGVLVGLASGRTVPVQEQRKSTGA